jgi:hypothetical protein
MAKQQKELDEKERKKEGANGDGDDESGDDESEDDESNDNEALPFKSPAKSTSVEFDMNDAKAEPIRWTSPNGKKQTAVRIPCNGTRDSFRKSVKRTGWVDHIFESMFNKVKVLPEMGVEWLIEVIFERYRPHFESFCERKGFMLPTTARMPKGKTAATRRGYSSRLDRIREVGVRGSAALEKAWLELHA